MRTWLYVDGYNFYVSLRRGPSHWPIGLGWCNFELLAEQYLLKPGDSLEKVRYFTSPVHVGDEKTPGESSRQRVWLAAIRTICAPEDIKRGRHQSIKGKHRKEKMTDVRIAVELILDGIKPGGYEKAIVLSSDQDLFPAAQAVKSRLPTPKHVEFAFAPDSETGTLKRYCRAHKIPYCHVKPDMLLNSRFGDSVKDPLTGRRTARHEDWDLPKNLAARYSWARGVRG